MLNAKLSTAQAEMTNERKGDQARAAALRAGPISAWTTRSAR